MDFPIKGRMVAEQAAEPLAQPPSHPGKLGFPLIIISEKEKQ